VAQPGYPIQDGRSLFGGGAGERQAMPMLRSFTA
jgi:hypothetical protein